MSCVRVGKFAPTRAEGEPLINLACRTKAASGELLIASTTSLTVVKNRELLFTSTRTVCPVTVTIGANCPPKSRETNSIRLFAPDEPGRVDKNSTCSVLIPEFKFDETRAASAPCKVKMLPTGTVSAITVLSTPRSRLTNTFDATTVSSDIA